MEIILDIDGWRKVEEVPDYSARTGRVEVSFHPPFSKFTQALAGEAITEKKGIPQAMFEFTGEYDGRKPVFFIEL